MDVMQTLQISSIEPTGSPPPATQWCFDRRVIWLELTIYAVNSQFYGDVSSSK